MKKTFISLLIMILFIPGISHAEFQKNLFYGSHGEDVKELQKFLTDQALFFGPITGGFYSLTTNAVKKFQLKEGIFPPKGYFGPITRKRVNELLSNKSQNQNNSQTICIESWQCESWNSCVNSQQTRVCNDRNNCGTILEKPTVIQFCSNSTTTINNSTTTRQCFISGNSIICN